MLSMGKLTISMISFNSYDKLPQGKSSWLEARGLRLMVNASGFIVNT